MPVYDYDIVGDIDLDYDATIGYADLTIEDRDLKRDSGLRTSVITSLFSNRRAEDTDKLPDENGSKEGWWADKLRDGDDNIGSKLWLIGRGKMKESEILPLAKQYSEEALEWMINDGVADSVVSEVSFYDDQTIQITIQIVRPNQIEYFKFYYNWVEEYSRSA